MKNLPDHLSRRWPALLGLAVIVMSGCAAAADAPPPSAAPSPAPQNAASLMAPVKSLIGEAECDHPDQCHAVGVGAKACGGPNGYLAWSVKNTDQKALLAAVQAQADAEKKENQASGLASDCRVMPAPTATCRPRVADGKKVCQLGQGGVRGAD